MAVTELAPAEERDHSLLQFQMAKLLDRGGPIPFVRPRVQVGAGSFRIPDVAAERAMPATRFLRTPPYIAVEILSREDGAGEISDKIDDYLAFGVPNIWVVDPRWRHVTVYSALAPQLCTTQVATSDGSIVGPLKEIFDRLPDAATE